MRSLSQWLDGRCWLPVHGRRRHESEPWLARERRDRRKFERAVAEMGAQLRHVRDGRLYEAAGYSTLEEWASAKFPTAGR